MEKPVAKEYYLGGDQRENMQSDYCEAKTCFCGALTATLHLFSAADKVLAKCSWLSRGWVKALARRKGPPLKGNSYKSCLGGKGQKKKKAPEKRNRGEKTPSEMVSPGPVPRSRTGPDTARPPARRDRDHRAQGRAGGRTDQGRRELPRQRPLRLWNSAAEPRGPKAACPQRRPECRCPGRPPRGTGVTVPARPLPLRRAAPPPAGRERPEVVRDRTMQRGLFVLPPAGGGERRPRGRVGGRSSPQVPGRSGPAEPSPGPVTKSQGAQPRPVPPRPGAGRLRLWHAAPPRAFARAAVGAAPRSALFCPVPSRPRRPAPAGLFTTERLAGQQHSLGSAEGNSDFPYSRVPLQTLRSALPAGVTHQHEGSVRARRSSWPCAPGTLLIFPWLKKQTWTPPVKQ